MKGKDKCKLLKEIRAQIAAANEIEWVTDNCTHKGECRGTCPKCESEVAALERALARRKALGKTVAVAGVSAGIIVSSSLTSCALRNVTTSIDGDMPAERNQGKQTERTTAESTSDELVTGEYDLVPGEMIIDGDMVTDYYFTDFTLTEPRIYRMLTDYYAYGVIVDDEADYPEGINLPEGAEVEAVGEVEGSGEVLICYEGKYYFLYSGTLDEIAVEVTD